MTKDEIHNLFETRFNEWIEHLTMEQWKLVHDKHHQRQAEETLATLPTDLQEWVKANMTRHKDYYVAQTNPSSTWMIRFGNTYKGNLFTLTQHPHSYDTESIIIARPNPDLLDALLKGASMLGETSRLL
jgi:hypothetical protein